MPRLNLLLPSGDEGPRGPVEFAMAPSPGETVFLNIGAQRRAYLVDQIIHGMTSDGHEILHFAVLKRAPELPAGHAAFALGLLDR